ncbi:unnamed protein product [Symbiodinium natans]|uniref:Cyclin N-terminal domain-containing protein n=1 Tax=Symbiodinium natans TaxID=878477 RepID=A0A812R3B0_9DINO|nr:unnamed protein product [Symbiodinium natans]
MPHLSAPQVLSQPLSASPWHSDSASTAAETPPADEDRGIHRKQVKFSEGDGTSEDVRQPRSDQAERDKTLATRCVSVLNATTVRKDGKETGPDIDPVQLQRKVYQSIRLLRACSFCGNDIELTLAYACVYFRRVLPSLIHRVGNTEAVHIIVLLIYIAHSFVLDESCPMGEWHKYVFKKYCSVKKMDAALFRILLLLDWRLMVKEEEQAMLLRALRPNKEQL